DRFDARLSETEMSKLVERRDEVHRKLAELGASKGIGSLWVVDRYYQVSNTYFFDVIGGVHHCGNF
ncbi:hypothetical protein ACSLNR_29115, partial [Escherichia coli]|uniref:hypothetical protein n=1 Tax=Escherichia coli TaxID=562 RepID=UPI003EE218C8